jgi:hypothetical protein
MTLVFTAVNNERASQPQVIEPGYAQWLAEKSRGGKTPSA